MKKTIATLIDELITVNLKIYHLVELVQADKHTREDAKKLQDLNRLRADLCNALSEEFGERQIVKL